MRVTQHFLPHLGRGTIVAWLVGVAAWLVAMVLLWPTIQDAPLAPRQTGLAVSLLMVAFTNWRLGSALRTRGRSNGQRFPLRHALFFHGTVAVVTDVLTVFVALLLMTSIPFGIAQMGREALVADLVVTEAVLNVFGFFAEIIT